ncbi:MAG TPA: hypothetical protein VFG21_03720 [Xanthomonadaceae bacterium]|nr:hypothetical protein [Xanthomonadaceae bacterium]
MKTSIATAAMTLVVVLAWSGQARAEADCEMRFSTSGWSAFYKTASGSGTIRCSNGQSANVRITAKGGGITFGKSTIDNGVGEFSGVHDIAELYGTYVSAEAHAGAVKSAKAKVMTKGEVSLALSGTGRGWDLGVAFGKFIIQPAR